MFVPGAVVGKILPKIFMGFDFGNLTFLHKKRWVMMFVNFTGKEKRFGFGRIKRNISSCSPL